MIPVYVFKHDAVTGEYLYRGVWYESYSDALEAYQEYEDEKDYYMEQKADAERDER